MNMVGAIEKPDIFIVSGLASLCAGLWKYEPWISLSVCGLILIVFGLIGAVFGSNRKSGA
jgi:hypothetical protein